MDDTRTDSARGPRGPSQPAGGDLRALGEYRLLRRLGGGGMGEVYLGYSERLGRQVAVKVLAEALSGGQSYVDRFYREAKSGALLNHPHIVRTLNAGQDRATGRHYLVLEYVEGMSAHALLDDRGRLEVGDAVRIALDIARALEHAQSRNVVHRDIKPDNILLTRSGLAKLADFGLAKRTDEASHLTATRQGFGTTPYMPYEQAINAKDADGRSDVYALGATLYHLLTGAVPFPGGNHLDIVERKHRGEFTPASALAPEVPPELDRILAVMMHRDPRERYQTASELIVDLERSGLAAAVPAFADPEAARADPWVRAYLATSAEPTRPDPESPHRLSATPPSVPVLEDRWLLRVRGKSGKVRKYRATAGQIIRRLRAGTMPRHVEAKKDGADYHPLAYYVEFQGITPAPGPKRQQAWPEEAVPLPVAEGRRRVWVLWAAAGAAFLALAVLFAYLLAR